MYCISSIELKVFYKLGIRSSHFKMEKLGKGGVQMAVLWDLVESDADAEPEFIFRSYSAT